MLSLHLIQLTCITAFSQHTSRTAYISTPSQANKIFKPYEKKSRVQSLRFQSLSYELKLLSTRERSDLYEPEESSSFGRKTFWDDLYRNEHNVESQPNGFSWYSTWSSIQPFWESIISTTPQAQKIEREGSSSSIQSIPILLPGVGNDPTIVEMFDHGWTNITAFDYALEGVETCKTLLGEDRLQKTSESFLEVDVADARALGYQSDYFVGVLDKGTLDAVYLSGGMNPDEKRKQLVLAVKEITRIVSKGGVILSLTGAGMATEEIRRAFNEEKENGDISFSWEKLWDTEDEVYITDDGFASIDVDATMIAFRRL